jgi:hypothetical protein
VVSDRVKSSPSCRSRICRFAARRSDWCASYPLDFARRSKLTLGFIVRRQARSAQAGRPPKRRAPDRRLRINQEPDRTACTCHGSPWLPCCARAPMGRPWRSLNRGREGERCRLPHGGPWLPCCARAPMGRPWRSLNHGREGEHCRLPHGGPWLPMVALLCAGTHGTSMAIAEPWTRRRTLPASSCMPRMSSCARTPDHPD